MFTPRPIAREDRAPGVDVAPLDRRVDPAEVRPDIGVGHTVSYDEQPREAVLFGPQREVALPIALPEPLALAGAHRLPTLGQHGVHCRVVRGVNHGWTMAASQPLTA